MVFADVGLTGHVGLLLRSIGDNRSTMPAEAASMVELLSPIALPDALAAMSYGFRGCWSYRSRGLIAPIDWGQSIYHGERDYESIVSIKQVALPIASICQGTQASARSFTLVSAFRSGISVASSTKFSIE